MFLLKEIRIPGCFEIQPRVFDDARGRFVKVFHLDEFEALGLETRFTEEFYSHSKRYVIRGMHCQAPPSEHVKLVYCVHGEVQDVVLDLRKGSPTYGQAEAVMLSAEQGNCMYIPKGLAHGFCAMSDIATVIYKVSTVYDPQNDTGVLWSSFGFNWATSQPVTSDRDARFKPLAEFDSPFFYEW
jgi:dTDP-4-dehydrorhamnose 3,5-epimerase